MPFEVAGGWTRDGEVTKLEDARLQYVYPESLTRLGPWLFQFVPPMETDGSGRETVSQLSRHRIITFKPPRRYRRALARMRRELPLVGRSEQGVMERFAAGQATERFDVAHKAYVIRQASLTAPIGWNARQLFLKFSCDFQWAMRELQWSRFCIETRDEILSMVGQAFAMIGSWRGETPRLVWDQLPTVEQVEHAERQIMGEGADFITVLRPLRGWSQTTAAS